MFWFKRSKIVVDCFTSNKSAYELFPIDHSIKFVPEWWKNTPKEYVVRELFPVSTIKRCPAIINQYKHGIILPLWSDLAISVREGAKWEAMFSDPRAAIEPHDANQWKSYANPAEFTHLKLKSPWAIKTKDEIYWTYNKPVWNFPAENNLIITPGIVEFKHQHSTHVNILVPLQPKPPYVISSGQPIAQMIPLTEKEIEVRTHLISEDEYNAQYTNSFLYSFTKNYTRLKNIKKEKKCPFRF